MMLRQENGSKSNILSSPSDVNNLRTVALLLIHL